MANVISINFKNGTFNAPLNTPEAVQQVIINQLGTCAPTGLALFDLANSMCDYFNDLGITADSDSARGLLNFVHMGCAAAFRTMALRGK